jgi:phosphatidylglycerol---prolipoprotein diacylglyceryl transferase
VYPTLTDLLKDLLGINIPLPVQTFGLFMGLSFALAAYVLFLELKRKEQQGLLQDIHVKETIGKPATSGELFTSAFLGFITGYKLLYIISEYQVFVNDTQGVLLSTTGSLPGGIMGAILFVWLKYREKEKEKLDEPKIQDVILKPHQLVGNITMLAALFGLLGAKIFHNLENLDELQRDPVQALLSFSGLTWYGGLICAAIAVMWYGKKHGITPLMLSDAAAPALMLSYGTGRIGCQLSGDGDWGIVNLNPKPNWMSWLPDWAWSYNYPRNVIGEGIPIPGCEGRHCMMLPDAVYPTPLYEAFACILLFFILWSLRKKFTTTGIIFFVYLIFNGVERFFIEQIRVNTHYHIAGYSITQAEIISVLLIIAGFTGIFYLSRNKNKLAEK